MTQTLDTLIRQNTVTMAIRGNGKRVNTGPGQYVTRYDCRLTYQGRSMNVQYTMGSAHIDPPTRAQVVEAILSDSATLSDMPNFEDWADQFGYDTDSRRAEAIYNATVKQDSDMRRMFGSDYDIWTSAEREV